MKVLNIGSMNLDYVYSVDHIIAPGETQATYGMNVFLGGKGINQSIALAKAGVDIYHGGMIGEDGQVFLDACRDHGVHDEFIRTIDEKTGHTIIQVDKNAQNCILLFGGANQSLTEEYIDEVLEHFEAGDILLLQNEVNKLDYIIDRKLVIALNPSPYNEKIEACDLSKISIFLLNEIEGAQITGLTEPNDILASMRKRFPEAKIVLTLGKDGARYSDKDCEYEQPIFPVKAVDTTAAGDTFTGFFIAGLLEEYDISEALRIASKAASIAVSREGAVASIPTIQEVMKTLKQ